jgi:molecular chaperone GrpE
MEMNEPRENGQSQGPPAEAGAGGAMGAGREEVQVKWSKKGSAAPQEEAAEASGDAAWEERVRAEQAKAETYLANWQRAQADLANLRRRNQQEREDYIKRANEEIIRDLLPVLDSFDRALASVPADLRKTTWTEGILLVERQLRLALLRHGVTPIEAQGQKFDPTQHEAVMHRVTTEHEDEAITAELQKGYRLHDRVLRPSLVEVAKNTGSANPSNGTQDTAYEGPDPRGTEPIAEEK